MHALEKKSDYRTMDMLLVYLAGYKLDHHSRAISDLLPNLLAHDLPHLGLYLDSRLCSTEQTESWKRGMIREKESYGIVDAPFWYG